MLASFLEPYLGEFIPFLYTDTYWWTAIGLTANVLFSSRFIYQWLYSEHKKQLIVPPLFWYLSFYGSVINLIYALHADKLPFILGFILLPIIHYRNIVLMKRGQKKF